MRTLIAVLRFCISAAVLAAQATRTDSAYTTVAVSLRPDPDPNARSIAQLSAETVVQVVSCEKQWCEVVVNGVKGYVPRFSLSARRGSTVTETVPPELESQITIMKTDLRKLVTNEEAFYADSVRYTASLRELTLVAPWSRDFTATVELFGGWWRGTTTNNAAPGWTCGIYVGDVPPYLPGQKEGLPRCWKER